MNFIFEDMHFQAENKIKDSSSVCSFLIFSKQKQTVDEIMADIALNLIQLAYLGISLRESIVFVFIFHLFNFSFH